MHEDGHAEIARDGLGLGRSGQLRWAGDSRRKLTCRRRESFWVPAEFETTSTFEAEKVARSEVQAGCR